jgi:hypothetical protein
VAASRPRVFNSARVVVAVPGVVLQERGWPHRTNSGGDGAPAGLTSWFDPADSRGKSSRVQPAPLRGHGALVVREWAAQCHGADTGHTAQFPAVAGMGFPWGVGGTAPGHDSQARDGTALLCQSIKCPYPRAGVGVLCEGASSEAEVSPRARRNPLEGGAGPRARRNPLEGGVSPRARRNPLVGGVSPRARRNLLERAFDWATRVGRGGHRSVGRALCVRLSRRCVSLCFLQVLSRIPPVF